MKARDILREKGHAVVTTTPDRTVLEAMQILVEHDIGSVVVMEGGELRGILTERDVLRLGAQDPRRLQETRVAEAMTRDLVLGVPDDDIEALMNTMTENRVRHLPVLENGELLGLVSIGDVVKTSRDRMREENQHLRNYIRGVTR